jgi:hypothetical protein
MAKSHLEVSSRSDFHENPAAALGLAVSVGRSRAYREKGNAWERLTWSEDGGVRMVDVGVSTIVQNVG